MCFFPGCRDEQREMFAQQFSQSTFQPTPEMADQIEHIAELYSQLIDRLFKYRLKLAVRCGGDGEGIVRRVKPKA